VRPFPAEAAEERRDDGAPAQSDPARRRHPKAERSRGGSGKERSRLATKRLAEREEGIILRLALAVEYRDNDTGEHTRRVAKYSRLIAEQLGLPPRLCRDIYMAAPCTTSARSPSPITSCSSRHA
jgi:HD-GYP domain-containing protein (c-di-GMP phosphodiesterase class II)